MESPSTKPPSPMRRNGLVLVAAGLAAMLVSLAVVVLDGFRRRIEFAAISARIAP